jgi:hypothetical protein
LCYPVLGDKLFGSDGFTDDGVCLKEIARRFLDSTMVPNWHRIKKRLESEGPKLVELTKLHAKSWEGTHLSFPFTVAP